MRAIRQALEQCKRDKGRVEYPRGTPVRDLRTWFGNVTGDLVPRGSVVVLEGR
jgi:hypothetical protein